MAIGLGENVWDPLLIVTQILLMQCSHYLSLGLIYLILNLIFGSPTLLHMDQFFSYKAYTIWKGYGWITMIGWILNAIPTAFALYYFVQRARKCLDFAATVHVIHFFLATFIKAFPVRIEWFVCVIISFVASAAIGEALCFRAEQKEIPLLLSINREAAAIPSTTSASSSSSSTGEQYVALSQVDTDTPPAGNGGSSSANTGSSTNNTESATIVMDITDKKKQT